MTDSLKALIIGGNSGLGAALAARLERDGYTVAVTGTGNKSGVPNYYQFCVDWDTEALIKTCKDIVPRVGMIDLFIYSAGYTQLGELDTLQPADIVKMTNVGLLAPALLLRTILQAQRHLPQFIVISSTSATRARGNEPMYCATKTALDMLARSNATTGLIGKTLIAAPAGIDTKMQHGRPGARNGELLSPQWVADQIMDASNDDYTLKEILILRDPQRTVRVEWKGVVEIGKVS